MFITFVHSRHPPVTRQGFSHIGVDGQCVSVYIKLLRGVSPLRLRFTLLFFEPVVTVCIHFLT